MSTRASISMLCQDGSVLSTIAHYDGYLGGVGHDLQKYFKTEGYVEKLLSVGHIRTLGASIGTTDFYEPMNARDSIVYEDWQDYEANVNEEYNYMYCDGEWTVRRGHEKTFSPY